MKKIKQMASLVLAGLLLTSSLASCQETKTQCTSHIIPVETPARPAGQKDVLGLRHDPIPVVRVGFIGLGMRGPGAVQRFTHLEGVEIKALCDLHPERVAKSQNILTQAGKPAAAEYSGSEEAWKQLCEREDIDLVYIATDWKHHAEMMIYAMEQGKHVACEVPAIMNLKEAWDVVNTAERTQRHCMMLENCVYDFFELTTLNMAQQGLFGEVLSGKGAYIHNLEPFWLDYENDWRFKYNKEHRGDVYATHGLGPVCFALDIHRGDKMDYLVAMDVPAVTIPKYIEQQRGEPVGEFKNGEMTHTLIKTNKGKTIYLEHNVASYRPYDRMYQLIGTDGFANKYPTTGICLRPTEENKSAVPDHEDLTKHSFVSKETEKMLMEKYQHPIAKDIVEKAKKVGGHGGMDFIMDYRLIYCLQKGLPLDMDVYDLAEWSVIGDLTRISLENNSAPVEVPDFTRGEWKRIKGVRFAQ
ncbi:Gfo/Idh/MocA family protein [Porphyromonas sp. COT-239 OH1446]|uniref:Gfo/Idh/MocA family protein n=1 Tax=Porphyromonas sp. COT-239 OH1446 TaxID=1515613 RepID=UPI00052B77A7|nr:Gfo/Idh/MocA family oxidoreductase [Porphyromonas sp. COT-239 OH1446]KGN68440.1 glycosyl hydrolase family 109 [Porphyromonas sp. COT-239 OH1446]